MLHLLHSLAGWRDEEEEGTLSARALFSQLMNKSEHFPVLGAEKSCWCDARSPNWSE